MQLTNVMEMQFNITIFGPCTLHKTNNIVILSRKAKERSFTYWQCRPVILP